MLFNSWEFLLFFPVVTILYFVIPKKIKTVWLLLVSYFFYMCWNPKYIVLILFSTAATYACGLALDAIGRKSEAAKAKGRKKLVLAACFVVNLGLLAFFKYFDFILQNISAVSLRTGGAALHNPFHFVLPVGISFFTFQALGYIVDVYRGDIAAERNVIKYALFVAFFPQLVAGPIERSGNLLKQIQGIPEHKMWDYRRITGGLITMLWGMFLKLVIADRVSILVDAVFSGYASFSMPVLWAGAIGFSLQIYCDFAGYSTIAIGCARVLGFSLMENFNTPYFSRSIREFWHRWHISLSTWFKDYLYIPLGGSRCKKPRRYLNQIITFLASGIWHGAGWTFLIWGGLHGAYQILGDLLKPVREKLIRLFRINKESVLHKFFQTMVTVFLAVVAWVFFRAANVQEAFGFIKGMFSGRLHGAGSITKAGFDRTQALILLVALLLLFLVSLLRYNRKQDLTAFLEKQKLWIKWPILFLLLFGILIFGVYGPDYSAQAFIYFQF